MVIECVQRLAGFEHHEIGDVDDVVDAANADFLESGAKPVRAGTNFDAFHHARGVAGAKLRILELHFHQVFGARAGFSGSGEGQLERIAGEGADLPGDADDAVQVRAIGSDLEVVNVIGLGAAHVFAVRTSHRGVRGEDEQPLVPTFKAEFIRRAHHAEGFDAADFANFDGEWFLAGFPGKSSSGQAERHFIARFEILRATDDLALALAIVDAADGELVGFGVLIASDDLGDHDTFEAAAGFLDAFHLDPEHGKPFGEFFRGPGKVHVLFEPVKSDFHDALNGVGRACQNCFRNRRSFW
jgi:hypothetical protein